MSNQRRQTSKANLLEATTQLEEFVTENFKEIVVRHREINFEEQIQKFVEIILQVNNEPYIDSFQKVITQLKHYNSVIRNLTAKFVCLVCYQNVSMQKKLKDLIPSSFIIDHLLIFNFPDTYNDSQLRVLKRECRKTNAGKKDIVFWYFPLILNPDADINEDNGDIVKEFREMIMEPKRQFLGFKTELFDPATSNSRSISPARTFTEKPNTYVRPNIKKRSDSQTKLPHPPNTKAVSPSPDRKGSTPNKSEKLSTIQSTPDVAVVKHLRSPTMGASDNSHEEFGVKLEPRDFKTGTPKFQANLQFRSNGSGDYTQPHGNRSIVDTEDHNSSQHDSIFPPLTATTHSMSPMKTDVSTKRKTGRTNSGRSKDFMDAMTAATPSTLLTNNRTGSNDSPQHKLPNFLTNNYKGAYTQRDRSFSNEKRQTSADFPRNLNKTEKSASYTNLDQDWSSPLLTKTQYKSVLTQEVERILAKKTYTDLATYLQNAKNKPFPKNKFIESSYDPARKKPDIPDDDEIDRQAVNEYIKGNTKTIERPPPDGISSKAFNSYRWKNHIAKQQVGNFRPSQDSFYVIQSTTQYGRRKPRFVSAASKHKLLDEEAQKIIQDLELDVNADGETYVRNLQKGFNMHQVVYGEKFEKYMDVLQFEKSNFGGDDERHLQEAYGIVDWLYEMKEKKEEEIVEKLETPAEKKFNEDLKAGPVIVPKSRLKQTKAEHEDDLFQAQRKLAPPSNLVLRRHIRNEEPNPFQRGSAKKKTMINK